MEITAATDETGVPDGGQKLCSQNSANTESENNYSSQSSPHITNINCPIVSININDKTGKGIDDSGSVDTVIQEHISPGEREGRPCDAGAQKRKQTSGSNASSERQETSGKNRKTDVSPTPLLVKVLKKSKDIQTMLLDKETYEYFNVVGATEDGSVIVRIYVPKKLQSIYIGKTYKLRRPDRKKKYYSVTKADDITVTKHISVPEEIEENAPQLPEDARSGDGVCKTLKQALQTEDPSIVEGKIVQVSLLKRRLALKDHEGTVAKVTLFGDNAEVEFITNQTLQITAVYASIYNGRDQLKSTTDTKCQVIPDASDITVTESDKFVDDPDFKSLATIEVELEEFLIASIYNCCKQQRCKKKKLLDSQCPTCHETYTDAQRLQACYVKFRYEDKGVASKATLFQTELEYVMGTKCDMESEEKLTEQIIAHLPLTFSCTIEQGIFRNITL
ncbi:uncharacterized protein LOC124149795 isoform X2 [Haliotis rufescens]|uniref:uncharacterized protein LOC124149795 isoform X2 n=1 Tax=Haliotis rufescens TaxID=6454 RepID=UPI00201FAA26|nr:uncharacterized protein LOC124149795 isoform X2 [Haliotis rufescens]